MTSEHRETLRLPYRAEDLFDLVSDVRSYPKFIPLISALRVIHENVHEGVGELDAEARVQFRFVRESFTTRVMLDRPGRLIRVAYLSGPFHELANEWRFADAGDGHTDVSFWIRYRFRNPVLNALMDASRSRAIRFLIERFREEAARRYRPSASGTDRLGQEA